MTATTSDSDSKWDRWQVSCKCDSDSNYQRPWEKLWPACTQHCGMCVQGGSRPPAAPEVHQCTWSFPGGARSRPAYQVQARWQQLPTHPAVQGLHTQASHRCVGSTPCSVTTGTDQWSPC